MGEVRRVRCKLMVGCNNCNESVKRKRSEWRDRVSEQEKRSSEETEMGEGRELIVLHEKGVNEVRVAGEKRK